VLILPDGTQHAKTPITYQGATCAQVMREAAVAASGFIPLDIAGAEPDPPPSPGPLPDVREPPCDEECRKRVEEAREEGRRAGYEKGRLDGRQERQCEIKEEMREEIARQLQLVLPPQLPPDKPLRMTFPYAVAAGAVLSLGYGLDAGFGMVASFQWRPVEPFSAGIDLRFMFPVKWAEWGPVETAPKHVLNATVISAQLAPCVRWKVLVGCAVADAGMLLITANYSSQIEVFPRLAFGPRVGFDVPLSERIAVRLFVDLLVNPLDQGILWGDPGKPKDEITEATVSGFVTAGVAVPF
jgi:hypothetical protein